MEIKQYLLLLRKWAWLLVVCLVLGGVGGYLVTKIQRPIYEAVAKVMVTRSGQENNPDLVYMNNQQLVQTYVQLLVAQPVVDEVSKRLNVEIDPKQQVVVKQIQDTLIIEITVKDHDPQRAANIANTFVDVLIEQNESLQASQYASSEESLKMQISQVEEQMNDLQGQFTQATDQQIQEQIAQVDGQLTSIQDEIETLRKDIARLTPIATYNEENRTELAEKQARLSMLEPILSQYQQIKVNLDYLGKPNPYTGSQKDDPRLLQIQSTLNLYQQIYLNLLSNLETIQNARLQNTPNVVFIEKASAPEQPVYPSPLLYIPIAGLAGMLIAAGSIFAIEYMDETLKTPDEVRRELDLPILGYINEEKNLGHSSSEGAYIIQKPYSLASNAFRSLRMNLKLTGDNEKPLKSFLIVSPSENEGKTTVAANLAVSFAQSGKKVVLVDADFWRPSMHSYFGIDNQTGLSDILAGEADINAANLKNGLVKGMKLVSSGSSPEDSAGLLASDKMVQVLTKLQKQADVVLIDTPPLFIVDAQILASHVDGVLLVIRPGHTHANAARMALEQLRQGGANVVGIVLNQVPLGLIGSYGTRHYYSQYRDSVRKPKRVEKPSDPEPVKTAQPEAETS